MLKLRMPRLRTRRLPMLAWLTLVLSCSAVGIYWWRVDAFYEHLNTEALAQINLRAVELADAVAAHTETTIRSVDLALRHVRDEYAAGRDIDAVVRTIRESFPADAIVQVAVIAPDGYLKKTSIGTFERTYLGDREHFRAHLDTPDDSLFISHPVLGRTSGVWTIQFTRPIRHNGEFAGVIVLSVAPQYFADSHQQIEQGGRNVVSLFRTDGSYLVRTPRLLDAMGKRLPADRPFLRADAPSQGSFRAAAAFDTISRTYAWRRLSGYPVVINVGLEENVQLARVSADRERAYFRTAVGSAVVLLLAGVVSQLLRRAASQQEALVASEQRHRSFFEKNVSVKLVIDPEDGCIVDANPAALRYYGYPRETLLGLRMSDLNGLSPEQDRLEMHKALHEERMFFTFRHRLANGDTRDVEVYSGPVEVDGRTMLYSIVHDVTARRELELRLAASEDLHRNLFLTVADGITVMDRDGSVAAWNEAALSILGVDIDGMRARSYLMYQVDGTQLALSDYPSSRAARGEFVDHQLYGVQHLDGRRVWISVSSRPLRVGGAMEGAAAVLSLSDITKLVEAEESLRVAESVFEVASEGIIVTDAENRIIAVNPAFSVLTGYEHDEVVGRRPSVLASGIHDAGFYNSMWQRLDQDGRWEGEISNRRKDGRLYISWLRINVVPERLGRGRRYVGLFSDITDRKREADAVWRQANFDALTGLANRKLLEDRLQQAIARAHRNHTSVAVLFIDLDRFKPINDKYGHAAGDELLRQVARRLENCLRDEDTVARLGGDEFIAVLPDLQIADFPNRVAEKIVSVLSEPHRLGAHIVDVSCSVGVSLFPADGDNPGKLIAAADAAMYGAKQAGRGTWQRV
ncbi:diguanylate cyclase [Zoogloea sp. LCSB751]|uniref:sensor domain-containing diguanylate cyclase n=1 Tax=Zoogloea sp. LCSB751 TaxID=1965277 RepID=UPI0011167159|nr:diguanylate cyclase [Zoogloea sp. LCSB751]